MIKFNYTHGIALLGGAVMAGVVFIWAGVMDKGLSEPPKKDPNDIRIEQHAKCAGAGMGSRLDEKFNIICEPNEGMDRIKDYWDKKRAQYLIDKNEGKVVEKKDPKWPSDPNSFETKSKRAE
jgi:hypothetical protein